MHRGHTSFVAAGSKVIQEKNSSRSAPGEYPHMKFGENVLTGVFNENILREILWKSTARPMEHLPHSVVE